MLTGYIYWFITEICNSPFRLKQSPQAAATPYEYPVQFALTIGSFKYRVLTLATGATSHESLSNRKLINTEMSLRRAVSIPPKSVTALSQWNFLGSVIRHQKNECPPRRVPNQERCAELVSEYLAQKNLGPFLDSLTLSRVINQTPIKKGPDRILFDKENKLN